MRSNGSPLPIPVRATSPRTRGDDSGVGNVVAFFHKGCIHFGAKPFTGEWDASVNETVVDDARFGQDSQRIRYSKLGSRLCPRQRLNFVIRLAPALGDQ